MIPLLNLACSALDADGRTYMKNPMMLMIVGAAAFAATEAFATPCARRPNISVEVNVQEAPIAITQNIALEDLRAVSARLRQLPAHPVLGFYAGTLGYTLSGIEAADAQSGSAPACPDFRLKADLVAVDRRIAIASDLVGSPCRLRAALDHYRHHAGAASLALHRFAAGLQTKLELEIEQHIQSQQGAPDELRQYVNSLLDAALGSFSASLPQLQRNVDTRDEVQRLSAPCDGI